MPDRKKVTFKKKTPGLNKKCDKRRKKRAGAKKPEIRRMSPQTVEEMNERAYVWKMVTKDRQRQQDSYRRSIIMPSYRKYSTHQFCKMTVQHICYRVFNYYLRPNTRFPGKDQCFVISTTIQDTIKRCLFERYKSAVLVDMIEKPRLYPGDPDDKQRVRPSFISAYRVQCDRSLDRVVTYTWENKYMAASAIVFGFFVE